MTFYGNTITERIQMMRGDLRECIEPRFGLLANLMPGVLSQEEVERIRTCTNSKSAYAQCDELLNIMQHKKLDDHTKFIDALIEKDQEHVANYIRQNGRRFDSDHVEYECWPLERFQKFCIEHNMNNLADCDDCKYELSDHLYSKGCINGHQMEVISTAGTSYERNGTLATMLLRRSIKDYKAFLDIIKDPKNNLPSWASLFDEDELKSKFADHDYPQSLITRSEPPTNRYGDPREVRGVVMLENFVYVVYKGYNKLEVFACEDCYKRVKDIEVEGLKDPRDMVGSSVTSQLFISDVSDVIRRVDLKTGVRDVFIELDKFGFHSTRLSLVENRLLVTSMCSVSMYDIHSGEQIKEIPFTKDLFINKFQSIESNRGSFFVSHGQSGGTTLSEIDSEGREIRRFNNKQRLNCDYLALDSLDRLLVADRHNGNVFLLDEHLNFKRILVDDKRLDKSRPMRLNYNKSNNSLAVGLGNGQVKIFE